MSKKGKKGKKTKADIRREEEIQKRRQKAEENKKKKNESENGEEMFDKVKDMIYGDKSKNEYIEINRDEKIDILSEDIDRQSDINYSEEEQKHNIEDKKIEENSKKDSDKNKEIKNYINEKFDLLEEKINSKIVEELDFYYASQKETTEDTKQIKNMMIKSIEHNDKVNTEIEKNIKAVKVQLYNNEKNKNYRIHERDKSDIRNNVYECIHNQMKGMKSTLSDLDKINNIESEIQVIKKESKRISSNMEYINDITNHIEQMSNSLNQVISTVELLQGKMRYLDSINDIKESIEKISKESNKEEKIVSNLEEEVLTNLGEYGEKVVKELTVAARCYAKNKEMIDSISEERNEYERKIVETREVSKNDGIINGKLETMKEILGKLDGIDAIFDSEDPFKKVIGDMLKNNGFDRDEELIINKEIIITEENKEKIGAKASNIGLGKYSVARSAILLNNQIYKNAILNKIEE